MEINAYYFYQHLAETVDDPDISEFFRSMSEMEKEHSEELSEKYHIDLGTDFFEETKKVKPEPFFTDLGFDANTDDVEHLYNCAIELEKRAHDFFVKKAKTFPESREHDLYLELAAEEQEHISMIETERDRFLSP
jgi:rubrerythrin